jgi:hypothetical protein
VTEAESLEDADLEAVRDFGGRGLPVFRAGANGEVAAVETT